METKWCNPSSAPIKKRPHGKPKKKRARELDEPTSGKKVASLSSIRPVVS